MKYIKSYILFVIMGFAVAGCTIDDLKDDVNDPVSYTHLTLPTNSRV